MCLGCPQKFTFHYVSLHCYTESTSRYYPCTTITFFMAEQVVSKQTFLPFIGLQLPPKVWATKYTHSLWHLKGDSVYSCIVHPVVPLLAGGDECLRAILPQDLAPEAPGAAKARPCRTMALLKSVSADQSGKLCWDTFQHSLMLQHSHCLFVPTKTFL